MPGRVRLVAAAGPTIGRGHLARALSMAESDWGPGPQLELELVEGSLTDREFGRLAAVNGRAVAVAAPTDDATVVVLDVPEPDSVAARFDPGHLTVFDDRESFHGRAALVVQPSLPAWTGAALAGSVLAGYDVVPVPAEVRAYRSRAVASPTRGSRPRVLICLGGSDPHRVTERLAPAIARSVDAEVDVVVGPSYSGPTDGWPLTPRRDPPDLVERLATADLVVLGAGTMKFEAACLGRAMLLVAAAEDQLPVGPPFAATGAARYLGDGRTIDPGVVAEAAADLLRDEAARAGLRTVAANVVDGRGGDRIAAAIRALPQPAGSS